MSKNNPKNEYTYCIECPQHGRVNDKRSKIEKAKIEEKQWAIWECALCAQSKNDIDLTLMNFIAQRIAVHASEDDDSSKFIFRELLQNADDVDSTILVFRFEEDALYIANNGRAFTTHTAKDDGMSDFERISKVLGLHKSEDKEASGHFGSGFQTVYRITNHPEIHSGGRSGRMNPSIKKWDYTDEERKSPFWNADIKGALFVLPWRNDERAEKEDDGVWRAKDQWPRWNREERRKFYDDLQGYIHQAFLCCKSIKTVRLIWFENGKYEAFQVERDFTLRSKNLQTITPSSFSGVVKMGRIEPTIWSNEWEDSFQHDGWIFTKSAKVFPYFIGTKNVTKFGNRVFIGKRKDGNIRVTTLRADFEFDLKRPDIFVLFPMFDVDSIFQQDGKAYLYSVIPLPRRSKNKFLFSAHFWPKEDRTDVNVEGLNNAYGEWYRIIMRNVIELYSWLFDLLLVQLQKLEISDITRQNVILNALPSDNLAEWMRPGRETNSDWLKESEGLSAKLINYLINQPILFSADKWVNPINALWSEQADEKAAFEIVDKVLFTDVFIQHSNFKSILAPKLQNRKTNPGLFIDAFYIFYKLNQNELSQLKYGQRLENGNRLDKSAIDKLLAYCVTGISSNTNTAFLPIVPSADLVLNSITDFPYLPDEFGFLYGFLPASKIINTDFGLEVLNAARKKWHVSPIESNSIISVVVGKTIKENPQRFENLSKEDHKVLSKVLKTLVEQKWTPTEGLKGTHFIPYRLGSKLYVGTLNTVFSQTKGEQWLSHLTFKDHVDENYKRGSIYGKQTIPLPGLTSEVEAKIKFIDLADCNEQLCTAIENALDLVKLMDVIDTPTNFVRHFLSPRDGSLFEDDNLKKFLECEDEEQLDLQKKQFQKALLDYFDKPKTEGYVTREHMARVPCLYDENGKWHKAGEFVLNITPELTIFGFKSLHEDLQPPKWPPVTLNALGVDGSPSYKRVSETIKDLELNKQENCELLAKIAFWLLTSDIDIDNKEGAEDISSLEWVPLIDGTFVSPSKAIIPTDSVRKLLGEDFSGYLYMSASSVPNDDQAVWCRISQRAEKLGFKVEPKLSDLLLVIKKKHEENKPASEALFDEVEKRISANQQTAEQIMRSEDYGYYVNGKWVDSNKIRLINNKGIPQGVLDLLVVLPADYKHLRYLLADGAKNRLLPEDILKPLVSKQVAPSLGLWDELSKIASYVDDYLKEEYADAQIFLTPSNLRARPNKIILKEGEKDDAFLKDGQVGDMHVLSREYSVKYGEILQKLGAKKAQELPELDLLDLIRLQKGCSPDDGKPNVVLPILQRIIERNPKAVFPNEALWPAEKAEKITWENPRDCYQTKDSLLAEDFKDDLNFLCLKIDGKPKELLRQYAARSGCKPFDELIQKGHSLVVEDQKDDEITSSLAKEIGKALTVQFGDLQGSSCFDWLRFVKAKKCQKISLEYSIDGLNKKINTKAVVNPPTDITAPWLILLNANSSEAARKEDLSKEISDVCVQQGFPEPEKSKLTDILYKLLSNQLSDWQDIVKDYTVPETFTNVLSKPETMWDTPVVVKTELDNMFAQSQAEINEVGYIETRRTLQTWYSSCQICNDRTPNDERGSETMETVKRVVCKRGGIFKGQTNGFSTDNSVLLCPKHQMLWFRCLVKFPFSSENPKNVVSILDKKISEYELLSKTSPNSLQSLACQIVESQTAKPGERISKSYWQDKTLTFRPQHLAGFLRTIREYFEKMQRGKSE